MFEYMDGIVDAVEEIGQAAVDVAVFVTICTAKAVLIITAPVWILPYAIWRKGVSSEIQTVEKELQEKTWSKPAVRVGQAKTAQACKKRARQINKTLPTAAETLAAAAETLAAALNRWVQSIKPALATLCENMAAAFSNVAAGLREESEAVEND